MIEFYEDLESRLETLSNYFRKYSPLIQQSSATLRRRLDERGMTGRVHLWRKAPSYRQEMAAITGVASGPEEFTVFLGTYFSLQLLHLHFLNLHWLRRETAAETTRVQVYRQILTRLRFQLRDLVSAYLACLVEGFSGKAPLQGIAICNVGMILDQDDLDTGVFVDPEVDHELWNQVIGQVSHQFLKYYTKMHFYLAERVGRESYLTTVEDYRSYLRRGVHNYVLISELLLTEPLLGDRALTRQIEREVINKFYFEQGASRFHEGYLRGMIGELEELLGSDTRSSWVSPKSHGLRLIHGLMSTLKTIHGIHEHGSRDVIAQLRDRDADSAGIYDNLQDIMSFIEMFFYLYQLLVSVDDVFDAGDGLAMQNLDQVAVVMGFAGLGPVRPASRLLTHYYENIHRLHGIGRELLTRISAHLRRTTVFNQVVAGRPPADYPVRWSGNVMLDFLKIFKLYHGVRYWDDMLQILSADEESLRRLFLGLEALPADRREPVFERLLRNVSANMINLVRSVMQLCRRSTDPLFGPYAVLARNWAVRAATSDRKKLAALLDLIRKEPALLVEFLLELSDEQLLDLRRCVLEQGPLAPGKRPETEKMVILCELLAFTSNNFRQAYAEVSRKYPEIVTRLNDPPYLSQMYYQMWAELPDLHDPGELKRKLAEYYAYSFCCCGLLAINQPGELKLLYGNYHAFFRRYFKWLYRACQWEVEGLPEFGPRFQGQDEDDQPLAVFCTGGYAREEAFENDIDLFVICRDEDPAFLRYATRLVNEINRELSCRGVMPHHRLAEHFGTFVIPVRALRQFLETPQELMFIEQSQLLGSRLLIGNRALGEEVSGLLGEFVFQRPVPFVRDMLEDLSQRTRDWMTRRERSLDVKEAPGGLRDIQTIVQACQACTGQREPVIWDALKSLEGLRPHLAAEFRALGRAYQFLRFFKDILALAAPEELHFMHVRWLAAMRRQGLEPAELPSGADALAHLRRSHLYYRRRARQAIARIFPALQARCATEPQPKHNHE